MSAPAYLAILRDLALCVYENRAGAYCENGRAEARAFESAPFDPRVMLDLLAYHVDEANQSGVSAYGFTSANWRFARKTENMRAALEWAATQPRALAAIGWVERSIARDNEAALAEDAERSRPVIVIPSDGCPHKAELLPGVVCPFCEPERPAPGALTPVHVAPEPEVRTYASREEADRAAFRACGPDGEPTGPLFEHAVDRVQAQERAVRDSLAEQVAALDPSGEPVPIIQADGLAAEPRGPRTLPTGTEEAIMAIDVIEPYAETLEACARAKEGWICPTCAAIPGRPCLYVALTDKLGEPLPAPWVHSARRYAADYVPGVGQ